MPKKKKKVTKQPTPPQIHVVDIWDRVYPNRTTISKDIDTFRGSIVYSESRDKAINLSPTDAACENVMTHAYPLNGVMYTPKENPKEWVTNMHKTFSENPHRYIVSEPMVFFESEFTFSPQVLIDLGETTTHQTRYPDVV